MNAFWLPGSIIVIGAALYAWGHRKIEPFHLYLITHRTYIVLGGALFMFGCTILAVFYFKGIHQL